MPDLGEKGRGKSFYAMSAESQSFHNILNDYRKMGITKPQNEEEKKQFAEIAKEYRKDNNIDEQEYQDALKQYIELTDKGEDPRFADSGTSGFAIRTVGRFAGDMVDFFGTLGLGAIDAVLPEDLEKAFYKGSEKIHEKLPLSLRQNIGSFLDPYHGEGIVTTGGEFSSADAEYMIGRLAGYLRGGGYVKQVIGKGARKINPKKKYDILNLNKFTKVLKEGMYIDTAATIIDDPDENMVNFLVNTFPELKPALNTLYVNPDDPEALAYTKSFINNLAVGGVFGSALYSSFKVATHANSNAFRGLVKMKNSKPVQSVLDVTKINPALKTVEEWSAKNLTAHRGLADFDLINAALKGENENKGILQVLKVANNNFDKISKKELKGNKLYDPNTPEGAKRLDELLNDGFITPKGSRRKRRTGMLGVEPVLSPELQQLKKVAPETVDTIINLRKKIDIYSSIVEKYLPKGSQLGDAIRANKGIYLTRSYAIFDDKIYRDRLRKAFEERLGKGRATDQKLDRFLQTAEQKLREANVAPENIHNALRQIIEYTGKNKSLTEVLSDIPNIKKTLTKKRKLDDKKWVRDLWGEKRGAFENYFTTIEKLGEIQAQFKFLDEIKELLLQKGFAMEAKIAGSIKKTITEQGTKLDKTGESKLGLVEQVLEKIKYSKKRTTNPVTGEKIIPQSAIDAGMEKQLAEAALERINRVSGLKEGDFINPLKNLYTDDPYIMNIIAKGFDPDLRPGPLGKLIMGTKAISQASKTAANPTTHVINATGNVFMLAANGIPHSLLMKGNIVTALKSLGVTMLDKGDEAITEYVKSLIEKGVIGSNVNIGQLKASFRDLDNMGLYDFFNRRITKSGDSYIKDFKKITNPETVGTGKLGARSVKGLYTLYQAEDDVFKIIHFEQMKKVYGDALGLTGKELDDFAANMTRNLMPNYNLVPQFYKTLRKWPVGNFVAFPLEMLRTTKNIVKNSYENINGTTAANFEKQYGRKLTEEQISKLRNFGGKQIAGLLIAGSAGQVAMETSMNLYDITADQLDAINNMLPTWEQTSDKVFWSPFKLKQIDNDPHLVIDYYNLGLIDPYQYPKSMMKHFYALTNGLFDKDVTSSDYIKLMTSAADEILGPYAEPSIITQSLISAFQTPREFTESDDKLSYSVKKIGEAFIPPDIKRFFTKRQDFETAMKKQGIEPDEDGNYPEQYGISGYNYAINDNDAMQLFGVREKTLDVTSNLRRDLKRITTDMKDAGLQFNNIIKKRNIIDGQEIWTAYKKALKADFIAQQELKSTLDNYAKLGITPTETNIEGINRNIFYDALSQIRYSDFNKKELGKLQFILDNNKFQPTLNPFIKSNTEAAQKANNPFYTDKELEQAIMDLYTNSFTRELR